jgi:lipopolysaccharide transport system ATP-binding protein
MTQPAIQVEALSKQYRLGQTRTLRERLVGMLRGGGGEASSFWALRDVSLSLNPGEVLGLIGRNGAGKSTLLKVMSRITDPTQGQIMIRGRVASLLEVGTGFHPELTGRENIFLNGTILGMKRAEIKRRFDEIVGFAEIGKFLDTPVKRYSSGMYVRLAFAVAAHLEPEVLLIDEVLAVGDAAFQRKCLGKMGEVAQRGRTVVFVSHNMSAINRICQRALWLDQGRIKADGPTADVVQSYLSADVSRNSTVHFELSPERDGQITAVEVLNPKMQPSHCVLADDPFSIRVSYRLSNPCRQYRVGIVLRLPDGTEVYGSASSDMTGRLWDGAAGAHAAHMTIPAGLLSPGHYLLSCFLGQPPLRNLDHRENVLEFQVGGDARGLRGERWPGVIGLPIPWHGSTADAKPLSHAA